MARRSRCTTTVRAEANALAPRRSTSSDGWIGDPAHASRASRHNPNGAGVVTAEDLTNDPAGGLPIHMILRWLTTNVLQPLYEDGYRQATAPEPWNNVAYFISADHTAGWGTGWRWVLYKGANPHRKHAHLAVGVGPDSNPRPPYDSTVPWHIARAINPPPDPEELTVGDISTIVARLDALDDEVEALARRLDSLPNRGVFDYEPAGGDTNVFTVTSDGTLRQVWYVDGQWHHRKLLEGCVVGSERGPFARGRRLDGFVETTDGALHCLTFNPDVSDEWTDAVAFEGEA